MTAENELDTETTTESRCNRETKDLASKLGRIREEINEHATAADDQQEEELYTMLALRLAETQRHLEAMALARNSESELSFGEILDGMDEELVGGANGVRLGHRDQS